MAAVPLPKVPSLFRFPCRIQFSTIPVRKEHEKTLSFPVAKTVKMRSMCQFCWSWSQGSPIVNFPIFCVLLILYFFNRSLTATFSGKIEFSVVSTNGEKVFRKKKSIKVGIEEKQCYQEKYFRSRTPRSGGLCLDF